MPSNVYTPILSNPEEQIVAHGQPLTSPVFEAEPNGECVQIEEAYPVNEENKLDRGLLQHGIYLDGEHYQVNVETTAATEEAATLGYSHNVEVTLVPEMEQICKNNSAAAESAFTTGIDLSRLSETFKVKKDSRLGGAPAVIKPKVKPTAVKHMPNTTKPKATAPTIQLQSDKTVGYLREAMQGTLESEDGVTHINTSSDAKTRLGKALDINAHIPFNHPALGPFQSLGGLWYFVGGEVQDECFRTVHGRNCRNIGKSIAFREVKGFKSIIAEATWIKINSDDALREALCASELPFSCYYLKGEFALPVHSVTEAWYMMILEEIRGAAKYQVAHPDEPVFPNFDFLEIPAANGRRNQRNRR